MDCAGVGDGAEAPSGYVVSLARLHERGFGIPAGHFLRALCRHYEVELHNFAPNAISQAAVFVAICEGYLGSKPTGICGFTSSEASSSSRTCGGSRSGSRALEA